MESNVEKIICQGRDDGALYAMMNNQNSWGNNPFVYLVWMMFANRMWGNEGNGKVSDLQAQMSSNQNTTLLMDAIKGNGYAINQLASNLNCDFNTLNSAVCGVKSAIDQVSGQIGFSAERVINAVNLGDCAITNAVKDCCCNTQKSIMEFGYKNELANERQTNFLQSKIDQLSNVTQTGFASVGYETQRQTCEILNAGNANTQRIIDTLNAHWTSDLQQKYNDARLELSQQAQNAYLISQLRTTTPTA